MSDTKEFAIGGELKVRRLGFGAMRLTGWRWPSRTERDNGVAVARLAVESGVNFIDTADSYALGGNEELLAEALHPYSDDLLIATKAGQSRPGGAWVPLGRPEYLKQQAELSLRRLRLDRIDLYQLHRIDPLVRLEDQIGALRELQLEGKIGHIGLSEVSISEIEAAQQIAEIATVQNRYNLADRQHDSVVDYCQANNIGFIPWLPIDNGRTTAAELDKVAAELDATPIQVALAWQLQRSAVMLPIPGTRSAAHLTENLASSELRLSNDQWRRLNRS